MPRALGPAPERILQLTGGAQATVLVGVAVDIGLFTLLDERPMTAEELAAALSLSQRGTYALVDGLVALNMLSVGEGKYGNTPDASTFLVEGKPSSLTGVARIALREVNDWGKLLPALKAGTPVTAQPSWRELAAAIGPLSLPAAQLVVQQLDVGSRSALSVLDVGGGTGFFSAVLLAANRLATVTQVDWPEVNALARANMDALGLGKRFHAVDGDLHAVDFGAGYDVAILSNVAHFQSPAGNIAAFRKIREALTPAGTLVISEYVTKDDRSGQHFALLLSSQLLLTSKEGGAWRVDDYRCWLAEAGFTRVTFAETAGPSIVIYAATGT